MVMSNVLSREMKIFAKLDFIRKIEIRNQLIFVVINSAPLNMKFLNTNNFAICNRAIFEFSFFFFSSKYDLSIITTCSWLQIF